MVLCVPTTDEFIVLTLPAGPVTVQLLIVQDAENVIVCATVFVLDNVAKVPPRLSIKAVELLPNVPPIFNVP